MTRTLILLIAGAASLCAETADEIMARVAANQDRSVKLRSEYVFHQNLLVRMKRANGKMAREETRDYTVTPSESGVKREMVKLEGKYARGSEVLTYEKPGFKYKGVDVDGELVTSFADDFGNDEKSKDGVNKDLFPLRAKSLAKYNFTLTGEQRWQGHDVYHIEFRPKGKPALDDDECWAGEVLVDKAEYEPVVITTHLAWKMPLLVKTMLGTNVQQVGFKVTYQKLEDGVWFPVSYGGEFKFRAVFLYARTVGIGLINSDFHRTRVDTAIKYELPQ